MRYVDFATLMALSKTCPTFEQWVEAYLDREYGAALEEYVDNSVGLRAAMRAFGAVISGSFALAFFWRNERTTIYPRGLDIYVGHGLARRMAAYLKNVEGYGVVYVDYPGYEGYAGAAIIMHLQKGLRRVKIIESVTKSYLYPLGHLWSSHVMNYLGADQYCIAYPAYTLSGRALLSPGVVLHVAEIVTIYRYCLRGKFRLFLLASV
ncbi:hypothetical protein FKP32DRAFT_1614961 [Trametes sanguinea]|nr:hypothetical protein FKP32DRAFT_1614961 [Trametes sanguinea]